MATYPQDILNFLFICFQLAGFILLLPQYIGFLRSRMFSSSIRKYSILIWLEQYSKSIGIILVIIGFVIGLISLSLPTISIHIG